MIKIYHNPKCSKSRETLKLLENSGVKFNVVEYLKTPPTKKELVRILDKLDISPIDLIRKNEPIYKESFRDKNLSNDELIDAMVNHPILIERPIVIKENMAVIGRPPQNVLSIIN